MGKILVEICALCGPINDKLIDEFDMAGEYIEFKHGDSDTGHRLQAELEARYSFVTGLCRSCAHHEAHGSDHLVE